MSMQNKWTAANMPDQTGRVAIVTGANSGIGFETARELAKKGATVVMACRTAAKAEAAVDAIRREKLLGCVQVMALDLSSLASIHAFAAEFAAAFDRLDLLINNAGVMALPKRAETADGFEMQLGTNHLGHFALTGLLFDLLLKTRDSRVVNVSSNMHRMGRIAWDDLQSERGYIPYVAYSQSKLANLLFTRELQRRLSASDARTIATAAHPGWTATNLQAHSGMARFFNPLIAQKPRMGALPTLYAATAREAVPAGYYGPDGFMEMRGYPKRVESNKRSQDQADVARLWSTSEALTGVAFLDM